MRHPSIFTASWVLLLVLAAAISAISVFSATRALNRTPDTVVSGFSIDELGTTNPAAADALRGRRLTASAWALGCGLMFLLVVVGPYRRGERWAWWAVLIAIGASQVLSLLRIPMMDTRLGSDGSLMILGVIAVGLVLGAPRMFARAND